MPAAHFLPKSKPFIEGAQSADQPNIVILVFDAWSACNVSLYGYQRQTTPFLEKLVDKAIVYHNHYATANWTFPGTTGLLSGVNTWTSRAHNQNRPFPKVFKRNNLFSEFGSYNRVAYTQNNIVESIFLNLISTIDRHKPSSDLFLNGDPWLEQLFGNDLDIASVSWVRIAKKLNDGYANSLFLSRIYQELNKIFLKDIYEIEQEYPLGLPTISIDNYYNIEKPIDWISAQMPTLPQPFLGYFHLLPPHGPYSTRIDFYDTFLNDGFKLPDKPEHILSMDYSDEEIAAYRKNYDEYILLVDAEINRLYQMLEDSGILENTWLIITSDHGELLERGIIGHSRATFNDPLIHIPFLVFPPGQQERIDIHAPTSAVDMLPTLLHLANKPTPDWLEGQLLPPYNTNPAPERNIFSMDARTSPDEGPFTDATLILRKGDYKLTYFFTTNDNFKRKELFELYNLAIDPEELDNLVEQQPELTQEMKDILFSEMKKNGVR